MADGYFARPCRRSATLAEPGVRVAPAELSVRRRLESALGRAATDTEAAMVSVLWSEHCSYGHSKLALRQFASRGPRVRVGPGENAGVVDIGQGYLLAAKIESHNHPSAVEPVEGAATGLGGIMRDVLATGARPIAFLDALFFGPPGVAADERLAQGVVEGVAHYANAVGVPTVGGEVTVDPAYAQSPLVNAMCVGLLPENHLLPSAARTPGELVVLLGSTTGRDGIAGASFASRDTSQDLGDRPQVQVGDPFRGKLVIEAVQVLVERGLLSGLGDLGAAGITSAAAEMAQRGHRGMTMDLAQVPLREMAMGPAEILLSESQERMLLVIRPQDLPQVLAVAQHFSLAAAAIGQVTARQQFTALLGAQTVADLPVEVLAEGAQLFDLSSLAKPPVVAGRTQPATLAEWARGRLGGWALADRRQVFERYDDRVGLRTTRLPGTGAAWVKVPEALSTLALSVDSRPWLSATRARQAGRELVLEGVRNLAAAGARAIALTDCLNFGDPDQPEVAWSFLETVGGLAEAAAAMAIPVIGGNVSFYNGEGARPILPTPVLGTVGLRADGIPDRVAVDNGRLWLALVGSRAAVGDPWALPDPDYALETEMAEAVIELLTLPFSVAVEDVGDGGLWQAVMEQALRWSLGGHFHTADDHGDGLEAWCAEGGSRYLLVTTDPEQAGDWATGRGVPFCLLGQLAGDQMTCADSRAALWRAPLSQLKDAAQRRFWR